MFLYGSAFNGGSVTLDDVSILTQSNTAPSHPVAPSSRQYEFPLRPVGSVPAGSSPLRLITEAGGESSDCRGGCFDDLHKNGGHFSLDLKSTVRADVVAADSGVVVFTCLLASCQPALINGVSTGTGPVVVLYHGNGHFTEYREFTQNPSISVGQYVEKGAKIGDYIPGSTGSTSNNALHFQTRFNAAFQVGCTSAAGCYDSYRAAETAFQRANGWLPYAAGHNLSAESIPELKSITLGGIPLSAYQLNHNRNGIPVETPIGLPSGVQGTATPLNLGTFGADGATVTDAGAFFAEHSPAYLWSKILIPDDADYLSFDYMWTQKGDGDYLNVYFDGNLLFSSLGTDFVGTDFLSSGLIPLGNYRGLEGDLLFELFSVGDPNSSFVIRNVQLLAVPPLAATVPEPSGALLVAAAMLALGGLGAGSRRRWAAWLGDPLSVRRQLGAKSLEVDPRRGSRLPRPPEPRPSRRGRLRQPTAHL